jgi:hypothetical protein
MYFRARLFLGCAVLLALALGCGLSDSTAPVNDQVGDPPPAVSRLQKSEIQSMGGYTGVVSAVGPDWFELAGGWHGQSEMRVKQPEDNSKPKRILTTGTKPGGDPTGEGDQQTHLGSDLRVGDVVRLWTYKTQDGSEWSKEITITRRPGGQIPSQWGDPFIGSEHAFHLRDQAEQDWEEKGIPIPAKYLDQRGQAPWTNPPYPPVAPMPRATTKP